MNKFKIGQIYQRTIATHRQLATVIAIVDGGQIGWLREFGIEKSPFELTDANMRGWEAAP